MLDPFIQNDKALWQSLRNRLLRSLENNKRVQLTDDMSNYNFDFEHAHDASLIENEEEKRRTTQLKSR